MSEVTSVQLPEHLDLGCLLPSTRGEPRTRFGMDASGRHIHIDCVDGGRDDLVCPGCGCALIPVKPRSKIANHFRHKNSSECKIAAETTLHIFGKALIEEQGSILLPEVVARGKFAESSQVISRPRVFGFSRIAVEQSETGIRPDLVAYAEDGTKLFIEIFVTHKVDDEKREKIRALGVSALEIDLSRVGRSSTKEQIKSAVVADAPREWVYNAKKDKKSAELYERDVREEERRRSEAQNIARNVRNAKRPLRKPDSLRAIRIKGVIDDLELLGLLDGFDCLPELNSSFAYDPMVWRAEVMEAWLLVPVRLSRNASRQWVRSGGQKQQSRMIDPMFKAAQLTQQGYAPVGGKGETPQVAEEFYRMYPEVLTIKEALRRYADWMVSKGWLKEVDGLVLASGQYTIQNDLLSRSLAIMGLRVSLDFLLPILKGRKQNLEIEGDMFFSVPQVISKMSDGWLIDLSKDFALITQQIMRVKKGQQSVALTFAQEAELKASGIFIWDQELGTSENILDVLSDIAKCYAMDPVSAKVPHGT